MAGRLAGKVCLVTGTGGSMGRATAVTFAREGALLVGCDVTTGPAEETVQAVRAVGGQMVSKLISKLSSHRRTRITLEVRETNLAAQLFFRQQEFKAVRVLRAFYEDSGEDAFLMEYRFGDEVGEDLEETVNRIAQYEEN